MFLLTSCTTYNKQNIEINALITESIYSAFGYNGYARDGVQIIEKDIKGRILYTFYGTNPATFYGLAHTFVCQYIDYQDNYVYYYPIDNFFIHEISETSENIEVIDLKEKNDWNKNLDLSKCVKKKINRYKEKINTKFVEDIVEDFYYDDRDHYYKIWLCDTDKNGKELYSIKLAYSEEEYYIFALIINSENLNEYEIIQIKNINYLDQVEDFKEKNNWEYDYCLNA